MGNKDNPRNNSEGYPDPTAYEAIRRITEEEKLQFRRVTELVSVLKYIVDKAGFEMTNRVVLRDKKTGKEYK